MSADQTNTPAPAQGHPIDAIVERLKQQYGVTHVNFFITPVLSNNDNLATPGAATPGGGNSTTPSGGTGVDKFIADLKEKTGATSVQFTLAPLHAPNNNKAKL